MNTMIYLIAGVVLLFAGGGCLYTALSKKRRRMTLNLPRHAWSDPATRNKLLGLLAFGTLILSIGAFFLYLGLSAEGLDDLQKPNTDTRRTRRIS